MTQPNIDYVSGATVSPEKIAWLEIFMQNTPGRALDLGCGAGLYSTWLAEKKWQVKALDLSPASIPKIEMMAHNLEQGLPFPDETFDLLLVWDVLEHLVEETRMWNEISRVLCPDGIVVGSVPHNADERLRAYNLTFKHQIDKTHQREYSPRDIEGRMLTSGLKLIKTELKGPVSPQIFAEFVSIKWARFPTARLIGAARRLGFLSFGELYADIFFAGKKKSS